MDNVTFSEEPQFRPNVPGIQQKGGLLGLMIRLGFAKNDSEAEKVLVIVAVIAVVTAVGIGILSRPPETKPPAPVVPGLPANYAR